MATIFLSQASGGAPALTAANGSLNAVLDWALVQNGWAIEYTASNARVYRAATGNRFRLNVRHDSAISGSVGRAYVRAGETATNATTLGSPFPLVSQYANADCLWGVADDANPSTPVDYRLIITPTFFIFIVKENGNGVIEWGTYFFGDIPKTRAEDVWNTVISTRGSTNPGLNYSPLATMPISPGLPNIGASQMYWARSIDGVTKSTMAFITANHTGGTIGNCSDLAIARQGYQSYVEREYLGVGCLGGTTTKVLTKAVARRGWVPNIWAPMHYGIGALTNADTFTDTAYNAAATFRPYQLYNTNIWLILEETDTWSAPANG